MAKSKAPLRNINLRTFYSIKDGNKFWDTEKNRAVLKQFKEMRPDSKLRMDT